MMASRAHLALAVAVGALALAACAGPPLKLYTLNDPSAIGTSGELRPGAPVIEVDRLILPEYLDTQDILVRRGNVLERSVQGRWASRLSLLATSLLCARLAALAPGMLVTDQWKGEAPAYRIIVHVTRLDITSAGVASLDAYWQIIRRDRKLPVARNRTQIRITGPVATDQDVVELETALFDRLSVTIQLPSQGNFSGLGRGDGRLIPAGSSWGCLRGVMRAVADRRHQGTWTRQTFVRLTY